MHVTNHSKAELDSGRFDDAFDGGRSGLRAQPIVERNLGSL
jgi:hypothetical protein